jgi:hypothetical protein
MHEGFGDDAIKGDWLTERLEKEAAKRIPWGKVAVVGGAIGGLWLLTKVFKKKDT